MTEQARSPRRGMCAAVLSLEAITLGLTTPVMISVSGVDTAIEFPQLIVEGDAADQQCDRELVINPILFEALRDLGGELASRRQDQRARHAGPCAP